MISESMRFLAQPREMSPIWVGMVVRGKGEASGLRAEASIGKNYRELLARLGSGGHGVYDLMHLRHHDEVEDRIGQNGNKIENRNDDAKPGD